MTKRNGETGFAKSLTLALAGCLTGLFVILFSVATISLANTGTATPTPGVTPTPGGMVSIEDRLARPTLPPDPVQADLGGQVFYYVCMACHGDQGQGLTPDWISQWGLEKNACWQSKCHAANHPPDGFTLPRTIPPVVGPPLTGRFSTALELNEFIKTKMPWQAPGTLTDTDYWQLTAFLLRLNGIDPGRVELDASRAALIHWQQEAQGSAVPSGTLPTSQPVTPPPASGFPWILVFAGLAVLAGLIFWGLRWRKGNP